MIGTTYSIFTSSDIDENKNVYTTGNLNITYTLSSDNIKFEDITPMSLEDRYEIKPYRITVTNSGNVPYMFDVILNDTTAGDVINYQYIMTEVGQLDPIALNECTNNVIKEDVIVPANSSVNVDVRIWISDTIQNTEVGKSFYGKLSIDGLAIYNSNDNIDNSILEAITKFYGEDYYYDEATQKYISSQNSEIQFTNTVSTYDYTGSFQTFIADHGGAYKLEAWGASGGKSLMNGVVYNGYGKGGYTKGTIQLNKSEKLYIYVGGKGKDAILNSNAAGGYNGGGLGTWDQTDDESAGSGGGATDYRLISGNWNNILSLRSRIMVAGGGGGSTWNIDGGNAGGLIGFSNNPTASAGTQIGGYAFGIGQDGSGSGAGSNGVGGGGGGYYGGKTDGTSADQEAGAGGSSYISGHTGCIAITSSSDSTPKVSSYSKLEDSYHYSNLIFKKTTMNAGNESMPTHDGTSTMTGNSGNGYAKITPVIPTITSGTLTVTQGNILDVSSISCVDNGAGCTIAQIYPRDTRSLEKGTHDIYILVKDDYDTIYKYTKSFTVT